MPIIFHILVVQVATPKNFPTPAAPVVATPSSQPEKPVQKQATNEKKPKAKSK